MICALMENKNFPSFAQFAGNYLHQAGTLLIINLKFTHVKFVCTNNDCDGRKLHFKFLEDYVIIGSIVFGLCFLSA